MLGHDHQLSATGGSSRASGVSSSGRAGSHPAATGVGRGGMIGCTGRVAVPPGPGSVPHARASAGWNPARLAMSPDGGSATNSSPIGASVTRASSPSGTTGRAVTGDAGLPGPNRSSTVRPSARARARATRSDGSDRPASSAETSWRDTPAIPASCCCE
jgi:hypothetical protein